VLCVTADGFTKLPPRVEGKWLQRFDRQQERGIFRRHAENSKLCKPEVSMPDKPRQMKYSELPTGNFFRIAEKPDAGEFFKCQSWVSTTADLEKMFLCKPDVEIVVTNKSGLVNEFEGGRDA
jgi:hypothetical protein